MHPLFIKLGVPPELQAFFQLRGTSFYYGSEVERFEHGVHTVPLTTSLWMAGNYTATELIVTSSAMEAIAYLTLNAHRYPLFSSLSLMAVGNLPCVPQMEWIASYCQKRKITLVFARDLTGRLADISIAAAIRKHPLHLQWNGEKIVCEANGLCFTAGPEVISLNSFEKAAGLRSRIRTRKPALHNTFLDQLLYENQ
jgi:uncharacterized protein YejL (UPF0352 family)